MSKKDINLIIPVLGNSSWTGGLTYQENLIEALKMSPEISITLTSELDSPERPGAEIPLSKKVFDNARKRFNGAMNKVSSWSKNYDVSLQSKLDECMVGRINVIFTLNEAHLRGRNNIIKLYWIPDFQQLYLKDFFSQEDVERRNSRFREGCELADAVIVSSENVRKDLERFAPDCALKCRVSSFVSYVPDVVWETAPLTIVKKYSLPEKFFYLPNQLWKHKNHKIVLEALHLLRNEEVFPDLVCTGNPHDNRDPKYYQMIMELTEKWNVKDQIKYLGLIPHEEVMVLIRQSIAVINPSLFEGWSTTVEESKSIGKQVILSDIEVHHEQAAPNATYFDPHKAEDLASILKQKWNESLPGPDAEMEAEAKRQLGPRIKKYADNFYKIIISCEEQRLEKINNS